MITVIGTGHVFNISEPIMFLIEHMRPWPQAVLVELDASRFDAMNGTLKKEDEKSQQEQKKLPWIYRNTANYQKKMAKKHGSNVGNEMLTAVQTGRLVGAEIGFIDINASEVMAEVWEEMSFGERTRYTLSTLKDRIGGKREVDRVAEDFSEHEDKMMEDMRRRYPTLVRKLIDERNEHMAGRILEYSERFDDIVVVVGDAHVKGLTALLEGKEVWAIRLGDIINKERYDVIRSKVWNGAME